MYAYPGGVVRFSEKYSCGFCHVSVMQRVQAIVSNEFTEYEALAGQGLCAVQGVSVADDGLYRENFWCECQ